MICFIGIDGSGKTTLARQKYVCLQKFEKKTTYVYGRVQPIISRILMDLGRIFLFQRKKQDIFLDYEDYTLQKQQTLKNNRSKFFLELAFLFDQIIEIYIKILPPLMERKIVFCDRYIYDTIATDLALDFEYSDKKVFRMIKIILKFIPKPDIVFYIDVPPEIAYSRKNDVPHINYLIQRKRLYDLIEILPHFIKIDGTKSIDEIKDRINSELEKLLVC